jgi:hypothetical protein
MKRLSQIISVALISTMIVGAGMTAAYATNEEDTSTETVNTDLTHFDSEKDLLVINKRLKMNQNVIVPKITFHYVIVPNHYSATFTRTKAVVVKKIETRDGKLLSESSNVLPQAAFPSVGLSGTAIMNDDDVPSDSIILESSDESLTYAHGYPTTAEVSFSPSDEEDTFITSDDNLKNVDKAIDLDFSNATFEKSGIYTFKIQEQPVETYTYNFSAEHETLYLDVYVNDTKKIYDYILYSEDEENSEETDVKTEGFVNTYRTTDLSLEKKMDEGTGILTDEFYFIVKIYGAIPNSALFVEEDAHYNNLPTTKAISAGPLPYLTAFRALCGTSYSYRQTSDVPGGKVVTVESDGSCEFEIGLHPGDRITIHGLPDGATYSIEEVNAVGYVTSINGQSKQSINNYNLSYDNKSTGIRETNREDWLVTFTNVLSPNANTGLIFTYAPYVLLIAAAFVFGTFFLRRRKHE